MPIYIVEGKEPRDKSVSLWQKMKEVFPMEAKLTLLAGYVLKPTKRSFGIPDFHY